ncbi:MAG: acetone carboxylase subunit gamma [Gammaproteobacteria bacterium]|nr:acetone carboxylase subunit gamma [Gammaproteobacteria bacterium]
MAGEATISKELIAQLIEGTIDDDNTNRLQRLPRKDQDRFLNYVAVLQSRVSWPDQILLRLGDRLYVVRNASNQRVVKCDCGHEFGDYRQNWKLGCKVRVRRTLAEMRKVYDPAPACPEPGWQEVREFFCPHCATQHAVEVVAPGYPVVFEMLPDLDKFYREYLGQPLPDEAEDWYVDRTEHLTRHWAANATG